MKNAFSGEIYTGVPFPNYEDLEKARNTSSKSVYNTTYDRYEKYHYKDGQMSTIDIKINKLFKKLILSIKLVLKKG